MTEVAIKFDSYTRYGDRQSEVLQESNERLDLGP